MQGGVHGGVQGGGVQVRGCARGGRASVGVCVQVCARLWLCVQGGCGCAGGVFGCARGAVRVCKRCAGVQGLGVRAGVGVCKGWACARAGVHAGVRPSGGVRARGVGGCVRGGCACKG